MKQLTVILENGENNDLFGSIDDEGFLLTTAGYSEEEIITNLKGLLVDFLENEGKEMDYWKGITIDNIQFECVYDLAAFFDSFDAIKINSLAKKASINTSLMRQYASGAKQASAQQAKKIEMAIHQLGQSLLNVRVC